MDFGLTGIVLIVGVVVAVVAVSLVALAGRRGGELKPPVPSLHSAADVEQEVLRLLRQEKTIHAIKVLRQHTRLGLKEAKDLVEDVAAGRRRLTDHPAFAGLRPSLPRRGTADLAGRVRNLVAEGHREQAIYLVRGETGMGQDEAELFVNSLTTA
ncbi:ribosomal protein L7/L12 [Nonomuraea typhae]|uniref:ribosomal protein L7/L12 n=1 Tax=Nonomuraea typhae TaxID=2603600 RepID=UPI0012FBE225|nr:ribosomal protein L7/L12 [Nonomuraea typhae]